MSMAWRCIVASFTTAIGGVAPLYAQTYPNKPIRVIVPATPGAGTDIVARAITPGLAQALGAQLVVDNRAGAGGVVGTVIATKAAADGYTVLFATGGILTVLPVISA